MRGTGWRFDPLLPQTVIFRLSAKHSPGVFIQTTCPRIPKLRVAVIEDGQNLGRVLRRRPTGEYMYLLDARCTIHGRLPRVFAQFDCRQLFRSSYDPAGCRRAVSQVLYRKGIFDTGEN